MDAFIENGSSSSMHVSLSLVVKTKGHQGLNPKVGARYQNFLDHHFYSLSFQFYWMHQTRLWTTIAFDFHCEFRCSCFLTEWNVSEILLMIQDIWFVMNWKSASKKRSYIVVLWREYPDSWSSFLENNLKIIVSNRWLETRIY